MSPIRCASAALIGRPVSTRSSASLRLKQRSNPGRTNSVKSPIAISGVPNFDRSVAYAKSQLATMPHPPASAGPSTRAITGLLSVGMVEYRSCHGLPLSHSAAAPESTVSRNSSKSPPDEKASPAPVITMTRTRSSRSSVRSASTSACAVSVLIGFRRSGLQRVTVATDSSTSVFTGVLISDSSIRRSLMLWLDIILKRQ